ncbi:PIN domain-containing protein [Burkholderia sp. BCC0405]|uniref:PIN domain-containing protein n=1 Tax=Burkholderia sp. BCC0405 TaxID=2676298 RepID=UPI00158DB2BB|nr:PIN domain-containing protein [Burkholderia sp. BCC0405]
MDPRIVSLIAANQLGAIALDTSVFDAQQRNLEGGLLRRVEQFHRSDRIRVLMPDVVLREVEAHLRRDAAEARNGLARAVRMATRSRVLSSDALEPLQVIEYLMDEPATAASLRMAEWLAGTRAEVLDIAARVDMRTLFDRYFAAQPPFAESSKKKHEFPDAVALLALEHWAAEHDTAVLVVSTDSDWQRFCSAHPRLLWTNNLAGALAAFQDESAQFAARRLAETLAEGLDEELQNALLAAGRSFARHIGVGIDARSAFDFTWTRDIHVDAIQWPATDGVLDECEAIEHSDGKVVVRIKGVLHTKVVMYFNFSAVSAAGDATVPVGNSMTLFEEEIPCGILVTVDGDTSNRVKVRAIEFLPAAHRIATGEIAPEWIDPPYEWTDPSNDIGIPDEIP